ncbi:MAG: redox-regulated ATPase YchF [Dehalococcoidales bacterium]|nr:redox-regulated ATPase YchF [Dehalococcoidales bacterium]
MNIEIGIIGLPLSGKTTVFNTLTSGKADTTSRAPEAKGHIGTAKVPDPRIQVLSNLFKSAKQVPVEIGYIDIGASLKSPAKEKGIAGELLNQLSKTDALINVVRAFNEESVPHPAGSIDVKRDIAAMNLELAFSDIAIIERRLERIESSMKGAKPADRQSALREKEILLKIKAELEKEIPIREMGLEAAELKSLANYQFLTAKPLLIVVNISEDQLPQAVTLEAELNRSYARPRCGVITLCGRLEMELAQLDESAREAFRADFGIKESALERTIKLSYELLGLITFLTTGPDETRAWTVPSGTPAPRAAGKIHSDLERGFIRAEVIGYDDLVRCGGIAEARKKGLLRLEGKEYIIKEGDVVTFLFNV